MIVKDDLIVKLHNGGKDDIMHELQKITSRKDFFSYSMFMCFIATHGNIEGFNTSDEHTIPYQDLFKMVSKNVWKDFMDKPKIFFIDTCRTRMDKRGILHVLIGINSNVDFQTAVIQAAMINCFVFFFISVNNVAEITKNAS